MVASVEMAGGGADKGYRTAAGYVTGPIHVAQGVRRPWTMSSA